MIIGKICVGLTNVQHFTVFPLTEGLVGAEIEIEYTHPVWKQLSKLVTFRAGKVIKSTWDERGVVEIPWEVLEKAGKTLHVGITGTSVSNEIIVPTIQFSFDQPIQPSMEPGAESGADPTLPIWAQLKEDIEELKASGPGGPGSPGMPGEDGEDGGYYTPSVSQPEPETVQFDFAPSKSDMPAVAPTKITLPVSDSEGNVDYTAYGLPILALTGDTSTMTKDNAVTLNYVYGDRNGSCTVKWQGNSSLAYPKKNYTIKFDQEFEAVEGWGAQKKYCLKADFIDFSHTRNVVSAKLWGQIVRSRSGGTIDQIKALPNGGAVDGFPCVVTINGEFTGVYNFNIPKDGWMFGMGSGQQEAIVCAENYLFDKAAVVDGTDLELEYVSDENNAAWVAESLNRLVTAVLNSDGTDIDTTIAQYLDIDSAIDYLIFTVMNYGTDNTGKNYILATYDGVKWFFSAYDMDGTWGLRWDGKTFFSADINHAISAGSLKGYARVHALMNLLYTHKYNAIQKRYLELRAGPLSGGNVEKTFTDYASRIHRTLLDEDARLWPTIPSTETNDVSQIIGWFHTRREGMDADVGQLEETGVTYYPDINGFIRLNGSVSTSANYRRTDYLPLAGVKEIEYLSFVVKGSSMATWALFDQSKRWIASSQDENGAEYYTVNNSGNTVTYGLLRKTLMVEELLEQYPGTAYIVLSTNNHADYEAKMDINNVNFGWSSEKQYITLRSVSGENDTDREPGGYYTPAVEQIDSETMEVRFRPSSDTMPDVHPVQISLPAGPQGPKGDTGATGSQGPKGDTGATGPQGPAGTNGTSVTVSDVSESSASGGTNVVTFSDGKKISIKNGKDGKDGADGKNGEAGQNGEAGPQGDPGPAGQRGTGVLNTTTGIAAYTTAVGGVSPKYRILLSKLKTEAKVSEVLVGDTVRYSTFLYPVIYIDAEYAYLTTRVSIQGNKGDTGATGPQGETGPQGPKGDTGESGPQGPAYTLTSTDKTIIVNSVLAALPTWTGGSY